MRIFLDQMFRVELAIQLQALGHDVVRASEIGMSRADDESILAHAISDNRILITLDGHFGNWAILPLASHPGVVRIRVSPTSTERVLEILIPFFKGNNPDRFPNHLAIVSSTRVRWIKTSSA